MIYHYFQMNYAYIKNHQNSDSGRTGYMLRSQKTKNEEGLYPGFD